MKRILLVEDNDDHAELVSRTFEDYAIANRLYRAADGREALDYLFCTGQFSSRDSLIMPAFVLLDLKLPRIDGLEVLRRIRADERTALLPVVVLTTSKEHQDIFEAYRLGANSYIRTPVDFERFLQAVGQLGLYWLSLNEPSDPTAR